MLSSDIDLLWTVIIGTGIFFSLAVTLVALVLLGQRRQMRSQKRMLEELSAEIAERKKAQSHLQRSEERYRNLVENIKEMYCVLDGNMNILYASPNMHDTVVRGRDLAGQPFAAILDARDRKRVAAFYADCISRGETDASCEFRILQKGKSSSWHEQTTRIDRNGSGTVTELRNVLRDITERKRAEMVFRTLPSKIIEAQESERRRVSRDLHDGVIQLLSSVQFRLHSGARQSIKGVPKSNATFEARRLLEQAIQEVRRISHNLRPSLLDDLGLVAAVRSMCEEFTKRSNVKLTMQFPENMGRLAEQVELVLFRVIQEALNNIEKHTHATRVDLSVEKKMGYIEAVISDNGRGFGPDSRCRSRRQGKGAGLDGMRERIHFLGGHIEIKSHAGHGVKVWVRLPQVVRTNGGNIEI